MSLRVIMAALIALALGSSTFAADPPKPQQNETAELLKKLFQEEVKIEGNINDMSLMELLNQLSKNYDTIFTVNEWSFQQEGKPNIAERKPTLVATKIQGMTLHQFLVQVLDTLDATYLVKGNVVEIVSVPFAARVAKAESEIDEADTGGRTRLKEPLLSAIFQQTPLSDAMEILSKRYDLSMTVCPQADPQSVSKAVSARILNLPAHQAIEMLAVQSDLRVVRRGNAYLITSREHAKTLLAEQAEEERSKLENERLRASVYKKDVHRPLKNPENSLNKTLRTPEQTKP